MPLFEELQAGQPVLSVDDEVFSLRLAQVPNRVGTVQLAEAQSFVGEKKYRPRDHRLGQNGFIEIYNLFDLLPVQHPLEALLAPFDASNELRHLIVLPQAGLRQLLPLEVVPAGEFDLFEQIGSPIRNKIKRAFLLLDARGKHSGSFS